jgi:hypothetical protein
MMLIGIDLGINNTVLVLIKLYLEFKNISKI